MPEESAGEATTAPTNEDNRTAPVPAQPAAVPETADEGSLPGTGSAPSPVQGEWV